MKQKITSIILIISLMFTVLPLSISAADNCDKAKYEKAVSEALFVVKPGMTDYEKALALHDYLCLNVRYDYEEAANTSSMYFNVDPYNGYGALINKMAVCEGYVEAYRDLLERVGIETERVSAKQHTWTYVKIDGNWYHVDVTWDATMYDNYFSYVSHDYFLLNDNELLKDNSLISSMGDSTRDRKGLPTSTSTIFSNYFWNNV